MKGLLKKGGAWIAVAILSPAVLMAQDKVEASVGADLVSGYIWRGQDLGNVSIQPSLSIAYKGFSLSAWGSVGFEKSDTKEFDLTLGYGIGGFSVSVTDYWFNNGPAYFHYAYASYIALSAPFRLGGLDWEATVGATPWENDFYNGGKNGFAVSEVGIKATKELKITDSWTLPVFAQAIWNPATEGAYFVAGLSF